MRIIQAQDYDALSKKAATILLNEILMKPDMTIGFATGSTPLGLYKELIAAEKSIDFSEVTTFNLDEYFPINKNHPESYHHFMHENLFDYVSFRDINLLNGMAKNPDKECARYEKKIVKNGIDVQILGIGGNGHIGFNEPGSSPNSQTRVVNLTKKTRQDNARFFDSIKEVPKQSLTMGIGTIMRAKKIILMASGIGKAEAVKRMVEGPVSSKCPASILQRHPNAYIVVDAEAASLLEKETIPKKIAGYTIVSKNNIPKGKTIVVISPHADDSCIGPGGTISLLAKDNVVHTLVMTTGHRSFIPDTTKQERIDIRMAEALAEGKMMGTTTHFMEFSFYDEGEKLLVRDGKKLKTMLNKLSPDIVLLPQINDHHPTHKMSRDITLAVLKKGTEIWSYESPWGLFNHGKFNMIVSIPELNFQKKLKAIKVHESQIQRTDYVVVAEALGNLRGALIPEQELVGFGQKQIKIDKHIELFFRKIMK
jgi:glucosamine-6-phosphate deaminase